MRAFDNDRLRKTKVAARKPSGRGNDSGQRSAARSLVMRSRVARNPPAIDAGVLAPIENLRPVAPSDEIERPEAIGAARLEKQIVAVARFNHDPAVSGGRCPSWSAILAAAGG